MNGSPLRRVAAIAVLMLMMVTLSAGCAAGEQQLTQSSRPSEPSPGASESASLPPSAPSASPSTAGTAAPGGGTTDEVAATDEEGQIELADAVDLGDRVDVGNGLIVSVVRVREGQANAQAPGEIGGSALIVTVAVSNQTANQIDLNSSFVNLEDADGNLAIPVVDDKADPLAGVLAPSESAEGKYVFRTPINARESVDVYVSPTSSAPVAHFVGTIA